VSAGRGEDRALLPQIRTTERIRATENIHEAKTGTLESATARSAQISADEDGADQSHHDGGHAAEARADGADRKGVTATDQYRDRHKMIEVTEEYSMSRDLAASQKDRKMKEMEGQYQHPGRKGV